MYRGWTQTGYQNKHYNINQKWLQHVQRMDIEYQNKQYNINQKWLQHVQRMDIEYQNKQYNINQKWVQHAERTDTDRLPKQALQYKPKGRRNIGRPRKRWRDQLHLEDQATG